MQNYVKRLGLNKSIENDLSTTPNIALRVVMVGDSAIGKSTLLERYVDGMYQEDNRYVSTIGVDFKVKTHMTYDSSDNYYMCKLHLWDTAGQERYRAITRSYYRDTNIFLICFDVSSTDDIGSIYSVKRWIEEVLSLVGERHDIEIYVLGLRGDRKLDSYIYSRNRYIDAYKETVIKNSIDMLKTDTVSNIIRYVNSIEKVKFIGLCSSKLDMFVPMISSNDPKFKKIYDIITRTNMSHCSTSTLVSDPKLFTDTGIYGSTTAIFDLISNDYIDQHINTMCTKDDNILDISNNTNVYSKGCCVLL